MSWIPGSPVARVTGEFTVSCRQSSGNELGSSERVSAANWGAIPPACSLFLELDSFGPVLLRFVCFQCHVSWYSHWYLH